MFLTVFLALWLVAVSVLAQTPTTPAPPTPKPKPCGPGTERECCVNYSGIPDPYWDFVLLPVTLDNLIEKFRFARDVFTWLTVNLPDFHKIESHAAELHIGRMAEFNRLFLEECLEEFCEKSTVLYSQLVFDNAIITSGTELYGPESHLNGPLGA